MKEEWKTCVSAPDYLVSNYGQIIGLEGELLNTPPNKQGYFRFGATVNGKRKSLYVHQEVAFAFIGPRPEGMVVRHLDGDMINNRADNLAYGTHKENTKDALDHGTFAIGERSGVAKLTNIQAAEIREKFEQGAAIPDLAKFYGVHVATIRGVVTNKHYNDGSLEVKSLVNHLSDELVIEARKRVASGEKLKDVANSMGFSQGAISSAVTGRTYGHLPGATNVYDYDYDLVVDLIKEGYPMTAVSEKLGISCKHVGNKFQEAMGMSIREYRKLNKVKKGARL